ncbi:MAG: hypothetical protein AAF847_17070, partial [Bacteroidota bacterium]
DYRLDVPTRFLDKKTVAALFSFEKDLLPETELAPNEIDRPTLLEYYLEDWVVWSKEAVK